MMKGRTSNEFSVEIEAQRTSAIRSSSRSVPLCDLQAPGVSVDCGRDIGHLAVRHADGPHQKCGAGAQATEKSEGTLQAD